MSTPRFRVDAAHPASIDLGALEAHIQARLHGRVRDLHLVAGVGGLRLHGFTHSYYAKQLAQHAVMEATDLPILANDIQVG